MPKKAQSRSSKGKSRARRPQRPQSAPPIANEFDGASAVPVEERPLAVDTPQPSRVAARPSPAARRGLQARRAPDMAVNYSYLRSDIRMLAVLAPLMVVILFVAYLVLHTT